jgi:hypothetical protein
MLRHFIRCIDTTPGIRSGTAIYARYLENTAAPLSHLIGRTNSFKILTMLGYQRVTLDGRAAFHIDRPREATPQLLAWAAENERLFPAVGRRP